MKNVDICEALYALPGGVVEPRRRPIVKPLAIAILGIVLLAIDIVAVAEESDALSMMLIVSGIVLACYGAVVSIVRLCGDDRVPYHIPSRSYMSRTERYYHRDQLLFIEAALARGDRAAIDAMPTSNVAMITLVGYHAADDSLYAYALYEYVDMEYRIIGDVRVIKRD